MISLSVTFSNNCIASKVVTDMIDIIDPVSHNIFVNQNESCDTLLAVISTDQSAVNYSWDIDYNDTLPSFDFIGQDSLITFLYDTEGIYSIY